MIESAEERGKRIVDERDNKYTVGTSLRSYDTGDVSDGTGLDTGDESLVQQHQAVDADINEIMKRFGLTQSLPAGVYDGVYGDFTGIADYDGAVAAMERAHTNFMALPPTVREYFNNDPGELISFVHTRSFEDWQALFPKPEPAAAGSGGVQPPVEPAS